MIVVHLRPKCYETGARCGAGVPACVELGPPGRHGGRFRHALEGVLQFDGVHGIPDRWQEREKVERNATMGYEPMPVVSTRIASFPSGARSVTRAAGSWGDRRRLDKRSPIKTSVRGIRDESRPIAEPSFSFARRRLGRERFFFCGFGFPSDSSPSARDRSACSHPIMARIFEINAEPALGQQGHERDRGYPESTMMVDDDDDGIGG